MTKPRHTVALAVALLLTAASAVFGQEAAASVFRNAYARDAERGAS
jgi:hypothetical protein